MIHGIITIKFNQTKCQFLAKRGSKNAFNGMSRYNGFDMVLCETNIGHKECAYYILFLAFG